MAPLRVEVPGPIIDSPQIDGPIGPTDHITGGVSETLASRLSFQGSQQPALEENDSHLLLVARACGYRLP